ncbi:hypothetical protein BT67DRAFT_32623 [Trichocladium antarcticum]|uniref:Uncharacterized protein n=1 Tax=Trichocladium antarcticum TaxID=1450529 RepID=A0AAN6ZDV6_9PEZI|nr:hypothetical protein BT67DRAFT_32623 [Trichocladium antarcticum]
MPATAPGGRPPPPDFPPSPEPDAPGPVPSAGRPAGPSVPGPVAAEGPMGDSTLVCPGLAPAVDVDAALSCPPNAPEFPPSVGVGIVPVLAVLVLPFALGSICTGSTGSVGVGGAIGGVWLLWAQGQLVRERVGVVCCLPLGRVCWGWIIRSGGRSSGLSFQCPPTTTDARRAFCPFVPFAVCCLRAVPRVRHALCAGTIRLRDHHRNTIMRQGRWPLRLRNRRV